jgi:pyrophosphatase PpaX
MRKINAILFDLDGTLVDSNQLLIDTFAYTFNKYFPQLKFKLNDYISMIGPSLKETFSKYTKSDDHINQMIQSFRRYYVEHEENTISIYPNLIETLKILKKNNIQTGIVTTKFKESAVPSIKLFGLEKYIDVYVYLDSVKKAKPDPEPVYYAKSLLKNPNQMMIIGDNPSDILSGKNANILTCGVEWSYKKNALKKANPDFWLKDFKDLIYILEDYNKEELK